MNVKYQIKEFTPAQNQKGVHSWYAEATTTTTPTTPSQEDEDERGV